MGKPKPRPKCRRCVAGHRCRIWVRDTTYVETRCAICRNLMTAQELMRPSIALVERVDAQEGQP